MIKLNFSWNGQEKKEFESRPSCGIHEYGGIQQSYAVENEHVEQPSPLDPKLGKVDLSESQDPNEQEKKYKKQVFSSDSA